MWAFRGTILLAKHRCGKLNPPVDSPLLSSGRISLPEETTQDCTARKGGADTCFPLGKSPHRLESIQSSGSQARHYCWQPAIFPLTFDKVVPCNSYIGAWDHWAWCFIHPKWHVLRILPTRSKWWNLDRFPNFTRSMLMIQPSGRTLNATVFATPKNRFGAFGLSGFWARVARGQGLVLRCGTCASKDA